jgi:hypothetical protein
MTSLTNKERYDLIEHRKVEVTNSVEGGQS